MKFKPNFFIVGAPKCGTTAWSEYLADHPSICFSRGKEPHYFNTDQPGFRWAKTQEQYSGYFSHYAGESVIAEASVQYLYSSDAARNIAAFNPKARILIMLRQPSGFIRSYHNQLLLNLDESITDLRIAWDLSGKRGENTIPPENREISFLDYKRVGLFSEQLRRYFEVFDRSQIMVTFMEDWIEDPRSLYLDLINFLGIEDDGRTHFQRSHTAKHISNRALHRITQHPPDILKNFSRIVRRMPGMKGFRPVRFLRMINKRKGYNVSSPDSDLLRIIDSYFSDDQGLLRKMLGHKE